MSALCKLIVRRHSCKKKREKKKYRLPDPGIFRVVTCRARCFGGFRSANTRFRFVLPIVNDRSVVTGVVAARAYELMGLIEQPLSLRFALPGYTTSLRMSWHNVGKSREILIATRGHFASEIEGGHLDMSRGDDTRGPLRDCGTISTFLTWPILLVSVLQRFIVQFFFIADEKSC